MKKKKNSDKMRKLICQDKGFSDVYINNDKELFRNTNDCKGGTCTTVNNCAKGVNCIPFCGIQ